MPKKFDIIDSSQFNIDMMKEVGLGGNRFILSKEGFPKYIVKPDTKYQGINEFIAQLLLKELGFSYIQPVWCSFSNDTYGATIFEDGLKRIHFKDVTTLSDKQGEEFLQLYLINVLLDNTEDFGEYYLKANGQVCSLDFGDSILDSLMLLAYETTDLEFVRENLLNVNSMHSLKFRFEQAIDCLHHQFNNSFDDNDIDAMIGAIVNKISELDLSKFDEFLNQVASIKNKKIANIYKDFLLSLKQGCLNFRGK